MTSNVASLLVTDGLDGGFKDLLVSLEFWPQPSLRFAECCSQERKYSVSSRQLSIEMLIATEIIRCMFVVKVASLSLPAAGQR